MEGLLALVTAFPTVVFAGLAVMCLAYWSLVLVGAADIDGLDSLAGHGHGGVEGVAASVKGLAGAVKGAAGAAHGGTSVVGEALAFLGLSRVPVTVSLSTFSLTGFFLSTVTRGLLDPLIPDVLAAAVAVAVAGAGGIGATAVAARSLARLFEDGPVEQGGHALVGKTCRITIAVDEAGGQARIEGDVIVSVRTAGGRLAEGEEAVITERADDGVFVVELLRNHLPDEQQAFALLAAAGEAPIPAGPTASTSTESRDEVVVAPAAPKKDHA